MNDNTNVPDYLNMSRQVSNEEIVISGISGIYPLSDSVKEFGENLYSKKNLISSPEGTRKGCSNLTKPYGVLHSIDRFDNSFFHVSNEHAEEMEPVSRIILEKTFEAIVDAGYNPIEFKGTNTGVYIGSCIGDMFDPLKEINEISAIGRFKTFYANLISYWLDIKGPSFVVDTACSSSLSAMECGFRAIQDGICDNVIVGGVNVICLNNYLTEAYHKTMVLSPDFICKTFDEDANGFARAEAIVSILLQKKKNARRIYANLIYAKTNTDGFKSEGILHPSGNGHEYLYENFYRDINIDPKSVNYIEAHGTATKIGDIVEVGAIDRFFCEGRSETLKIGSVRSNMGHSEGAAGACSITKAIIAYENGLMPPNINLKKLNSRIAGFHNGRIEVVTEPIPCDKFLIGINSFGIGGANGHLLLSPNFKEKKLIKLTSDDMPRLVLASGRTEEAIDVLLNDLEKHKHDMEYVALYHQIFSKDINGHLHRGYTILQNEKESFKHKLNYTGEQRPIWFVFAGMGSQWPSMGKSLMKIPIFAKSIQESHEILRKKHLDLVKIITEDDPKIFDNILHSFVGIAAIQIALLDLLNELEIIPDGIIGHSVGELGCAYADGCLTAEEMILVAYYRGLVSLETKFIHGTMAAVGEGYHKMKDLVPPEIEIACRNGPSSCTLSGPTENIEDFVNVLKKKDIFARTVNTGNIAYHSRYIAHAGPKFISLLKETVPEKLRSPKWVCTSAPESEWDTESVKYSSPDYHTRNLLGPVLFEDGLKHLPNNAITIEIAPHGLLQAILKRSLPSTVTNIPLTLKNHEDNAEFFLNALGKLYELGVNLKIHKLYPPIEFPVSRGTPMISHLIKWQHVDQFSIGGSSGLNCGEKDVVFRPNRPDSQYIKGHVIDGRNIFPATGYLVLIWQTLASVNYEIIENTPVVFENVRFERATNIPENAPVQFHISVQRGTGHFEILNNESVVAKGRAFIPKKPSQEMLDIPPIEDKLEPGAIPLVTRDLYKELRLRGYYYKGLFKKMVYANPNGNYGKVSWTNNFVTFMDTMAHLAALKKDLRDLAVPTAIRKIVIDVKKHFEILKTLDKENPEFPVYFHEQENVLCSGGVEMIGFKCSAIGRKKNTAEPVLEKYQFVAYHDDLKEEIDLFTAVRLCVHIILENIPLNKVKCVEVLKEKLIDEESLISKMVAQILADLPLIQAEISIFDEENNSLNEENLGGIKVQTGKLPSNNSHLFVITSNISSDENILSQIMDTLKDQSFIITREKVMESETIDNLGFDICFSRIIANERLLLLKKKSSIGQPLASINITNSSYLWIETLKQQLTSLDENNKQKLILYSEKEPLSGILGLFNCLRREPNSQNLRCFFILDDNAPDFSIENEFYKNQWEKNLTHNVYKNGEWGSYRHILLEPLNETLATHAIGDIVVRGDLSTLTWFEGPIDPLKDTFNDNRLIYNYYIPLNFRDVIFALGKVSVSDVHSVNRLQQENVLGSEFCGKDANGERYMGISLTSGISNYIPAVPHFTWKVPDHWTLEEASTVPLAYFTAIMALIKFGGLKKEHSVLIHAGSGGVGQACLNICTYYGCTIFTTVGTPEKIKFIRETFPQIPESHIGNSRDTSFEKLVMKNTNYRGVDLVLNSLSDDKLKASIRCVAEEGKFLEIGKVDLVTNNSLELGHFINNISFKSLQLDLMLLKRTKEDMKEDWDLMNEFIDKGIIKPLIRTIFAANELELALRYMATGKHTGKVIIKLRDEDLPINSKPTILPMPVRPKVLCKANKSYVIIGGLGGFGLELADWLILRGARNVVLSSRNGIKKGYQYHRTQIWKTYGARVVIDINDVTKEEGVKKLLETANSLGPVDGIFNVAVVLQDNPFEKQTEETFRITAGAKEIATIHLDRLSRIMCPHLNYFVVFSSVTCGRGNINQSNYGMTNSVMERLCEKRIDDNLPALAVEWGAIGEVGIVAEMAEDNHNIVIGGTLQQKISSCLAVLNDLMKQPHPIVSSIVVAEKRSTGSNIINTVANILGIKDLKTISLTWTLPELGLDSMTAVELKSVLDAEFGTFFTPEEIKTLTFSKLYKLVEEKGKQSEALLNKGLSAPTQDFSTKNTIFLPIIRLPSLTDNGSNKEVSTDTNTIIFYFPGAEGDSSIAKHFAANFNVQVLGLQYYNSEFRDTFEGSAQYFASLIIDRLKADQKFYFVGHSFGTIIAVETARILEKQGRTGNLWLIDGSFDYAKALLGTELCTADSDLEMLAIKSVLPHYSLDQIDEKVLKKLSDTKDWNERKKYIAPLISDVFGPELCGIETSEARLDLGIIMQKCLRNYRFSGEKLKTEATLIRSNVDNYNLEKDYGWSKYFLHPIKIHLIDASHEKIVSEELTRKIITETMF